MGKWLDEHGFALFWLSFGLIFTLLFGGFIISAIIQNDNRTEAYEIAQQNLQIQGYQIHEGIINSPTVIEKTSNYNYFTEKATNTLPIYHTTEGREAYVAIFNSTYGLAYYPEYAQAGWFGIG